MFEGCYMPGHPVILVYLLDGEWPVICDAGYSPLGNVFKAVQKHMDEIQLNEHA